MANKNKKNFNRAGFSLIEMIVAMAVFLTVVMASVASFVSVIKTQRTTREIQKKIEGAGTAVEIMSKVIRMSSLVTSPSEKEIILYNNSQDKCISYKFQNNNNLEVSEFPSSGDHSDCAEASNYSSYLVMISGVTGSFKVVETKTTSPKKMGKATILIKVGQDHLQTSVSFMNYASII